MTIDWIESQPPTSPWACISSPTSTGVRKMPSRLEAEAAQTAAATLPRPIEVKAIDDCTVEGRQQRNSMPLDRVGDSTPDLLISRPSAGNSTKVKARIVRCSRQWVRPATTASRDSLAPCRKNSRAMAILTTQPTIVAASPRTGRIEASTTMPNRARM
jgi:hypothetical protein